MEGELLNAFGIKICDLESSSVILFKEQSHKGRIIVAYKEHIGDMALLSDDDRTSFFADVAKVAKAIHKVFNPDKINYGAYGDTGNHLHFHLVPKYKDQFEWATTFEMNPGKKFLTETEYKDIIKLIKDNL
jgi:diadenosine tetraphosphate (Ap4A) HIT family hydrolase